MDNQNTLLTIVGLVTGAVFSVETLLRGRRDAERAQRDSERAQREAERAQRDSERAQRPREPSVSPKRAESNLRWTA